MVYYVDGLYGSDAADGLTRQTAFATTARVNALTLSGGDEVRFRLSLIHISEPTRH